MAYLIQQFLLLLTAGLIVVYLYISYTDFTKFKITNFTVLLLLLIGCAAKLATGLENLVPDLITSGLLFAVTFPFWLARLVGAGDVKLLAVSGFIIGAENILDFAIYMLIFSFLVIFIAAFSRFLLFLPTFVNRQLFEILQKGKVPYGVPISLAAVTILAARIAAAI